MYHFKNCSNYWIYQMTCQNYGKESCICISSTFWIYPKDWLTKKKIFSWMNHWRLHLSGGYTFKTRTIQQRNQSNRGGWIGCSCWLVTKNDIGQRNFFGLQNYDKVSKCMKKTLTEVVQQFRHMKWSLRRNKFLFLDQLFVTVVANWELTKPRLWYEMRSL